VIYFAAAFFASASRYELAKEIPDIKADNPKECEQAEMRHTSFLLGAHNGSLLLLGLRELRARLLVISSVAPIASVFYTITATYRVFGLLCK
jgi:hypothetical protein